MSSVALATPVNSAHAEKTLWRNGYLLLLADERNLGLRKEIKSALSEYRLTVDGEEIIILICPTVCRAEVVADRDLAAAQRRLDLQKLKKLVSGEDQDGVLQHIFTKML